MRFVVACAAILLCSTAVRAEPPKREPGDPIELRLGTLAIDGSRYMVDILALSAAIEQRTKHTVRLHWITGGQLGDETQMAALVTRGELDGGGFSGTGLAAIVPDMTAWAKPDLFPDTAEVDRVTAQRTPAIADAFAKQHAVFLMWADLGFSHYFSTTPIASLDDVRARAKPWLGAPPEGKLAHAIAARTTTAWAMPPLYLLAIGTDKAVAMTDAHYNYVIGGLVIASASWARLTPKEQDVVRTVAHDWEPKLRASWRAETARGIAALQKAGVKIYRQP